MAGGDDGLSEAEPFAADFHCVPARKPVFPQEDVHPEPPEPACRIVEADARAQPSHPFHDGWKVDASARRDADAVIAGIADIP